MLRTARNLQKFFGKHGADFGWNPTRAGRFINTSTVEGVRTIQGAYRGNPATHYVDPKTGLNVVADPAGNFVTGYQLGADQLRDVLTKCQLF